MIYIIDDELDGWGVLRGGEEVGGPGPGPGRGGYVGGNER